MLTIPLKAAWSYNAVPLRRGPERPGACGKVTEANPGWLHLPAYRRVQRRKVGRPG